MDKEKLKKLKEFYALAKQNKAEQQIRKFFKLPDYNLNRDEFLKGYKKIISQVNNLEIKIIERIRNKTITEKENLDKFKNDSADSISKLKEKFVKLLGRALKEQENGMNFIRDKVRRIKEGKDGRDGIDGKDGADGLQGASGSPDTPEAIANKLEELKDKGRLKIEAVLNLEDRLKRLEERPIGRSGGARKVVYTKRINLTSQCNGTLKEFLLPKDTINVLGVWGTQFPITFDEADFTFSGNTLTLTSEVGAPQTDQTLFCLIQTLFYG